MDKLLSMEAVAATEAGAIAAARLMGRGDREGADRAAVEAMRRAMEDADMAGTIVIGEGERDEAPMLYIGEKVGNPDAALAIDIAVDPLEGTNLVATGAANATSVLAAAEPGGLFHAPDTYMKKLIVGPQVAGHVSINDPVEVTIRTIAEKLGREVWDITVVILDRPRHADLIAEVRSTGARIKLIPDGDLTAGISVAVSGTGVHAVMGTGGAPEGVLTAAALKCLGGEIQGKFAWRSAEEKERARAMGVDVDDGDRVYTTNDLASGESVIFSATGVTDGELLRGVRFFGGGARTHSLLMSYRRGVIRFLDTVHTFDRQFPPRVRL
ncbi:MAG TPA: class II fructose-bisphosphatase [candidate division Zixibacteria bacterium]|nr:class II fructose-bisphosphatase [candidate division Zixibacteria bacterium]